MSICCHCAWYKKTEKYTSETHAHYNNSPKERQALSVIELTPLNGYITKTSSIFVIYFLQKSLQ